jgi:hypothetical protein
MARRKAAVADAAAAPLSSVPADAPHWQVARLAEPGQVFTETDIRRNTVTVVADARGVVIPRSVAENALIDRLPVAPADILAAPIPDAPPTEPTDDAGDDAAQED